MKKESIYANNNIKNMNCYAINNINLGYKFPLEITSQNGFGCRFIQVIYFLYGITTPILFLIILFILFVIPLKLNA